MRDTYLPFSAPSIGEEEISEVVDTLRSGWITTGPKTKRFEEQFEHYIGSRHAIAVNSCTAGLHIALAALGIGPGDEVIVPTLTFCSTANVVVHLGARPVLADVGEDLLVSAETIERAITSKTRAIVPVHYGGQACELRDIYALACLHNLPVVEDAAHAAGATYRGYRIGADELPTSCLGREMTVITSFSFYATKNMTTGEGGMITTSNDELAERMRLLSLHGMSRDAWKRYTSAGSWYYEVVLPGFKDNMTDIEAALGIHQLGRLDGFIATRQRYARLYDQGLADVAEVETPIAHGDRNHTYHLYVIRLNLERLVIDRAQFIERLKAINIGTSVHFVPVHMHPYYHETYGYRPEALPVAYREYQRLISLPIYPAMTERDVQDVVDAVKHVVDEFRAP